MLFPILYFLAEVDDDLEVGEVPLDEVLLDLLHGDALRLHGLGDRNGFFGLVETGPGASAKLLRPKCRNVDKEKTAFDRRRLRVNDRPVVCGMEVAGCRLHLRDFNV